MKNTYYHSLLFLILASFCFLVGMELEESLVNLKQHLEELQHALQKTHVEKGPIEALEEIEVAISAIPFKDASHFIRGIIEDLGIEEGTIPLPLSQSMYNNLVAYHEGRSLDDYALEDLFQLADAAFIIEYDGQKTIADGIIDRLVDQRDRFLAGTLLINLKSSHELIRNQLLERIKPCISAPRLLHAFSMKGEDYQIHLPGRTQYGNSLVISPDGQRYVEGSVDRDAEVFDSRTGKLDVILPESAQYFLFPVISPDGSSYAAWNDPLNAVKVWELETGNEIGMIKSEGLGGKVRSILFSSDGKSIITGGLLDGSVKVWDIKTGAEIRSLGAGEEETEKRVKWLGLSADGKVTVVYNDFSIKIFDLATGSLDREIELGGIYPPSNSVLSPDGRYLISWLFEEGLTADYFRRMMAGEELPELPPNELFIWDIQEAKKIKTLKLKGPVAGFHRPTKENLPIALSSDAKYILIAELPPFFIDRQTEMRREIKGCEGTLYGLQITANGQYGLIRSDDRGCIYQFANPELESQLGLLSLEQLLTIYIACTFPDEVSRDNFYIKEINMEPRYPASLKNLINSLL